MENYKVREHITLKTSHIVGQYYRFLKKTKVLTDVQIFHAIFLIILLPHYEFKRRLIDEVKTWYDLASNGQFIFKDKIIELNHHEDEVELNNNSFLFTITIQVIVKLLNKTNVANRFLFLNYLQEKEVKNLIYEKLQEGIMGINNEYSLTQNKIKENIINFFTVESYAVEVYNIKDLISFSLDWPVVSENNSDQTILINNLDDLLDTGTKEELKEKHQIYALCSGSIHNNHSNKYEYLNLINKGKTLYRKTDLFATGIEENFANDHFICVDCIIERYAPIQLLIDEDLTTNEEIKKIYNESTVFEVDRIILSNSIIKYMPISHDDRKRLLSIC